MTKTPKYIIVSGTFSAKKGDTQSYRLLITPDAIHPSLGSSFGAPTVQGLSDMNGMRAQPRGFRVALLATDADVDNLKNNRCDYAGHNDNAGLLVHRGAEIPEFQIDVERYFHNKMPHFTITTATYGAVVTESTKAALTEQLGAVIMAAIDEHADDWAVMRYMITQAKIAQVLKRLDEERKRMRISAVNWLTAESKKICATRGPMTLERAETSVHDYEAEGFTRKNATFRVACECHAAGDTVIASLVCELMGYEYDLLCLQGTVHTT